MRTVIAMDHLGVAQARQNSSSVVLTVLLITVGLHVLIPKAGLKVGDVPVTLADVCFTLLLWPAFTSTLNPQAHRRLRTATGFILAGMVYFVARTLMMGLDAQNLAKFTVLGVYPLIFFIMIKKVRTGEQARTVVRLIGLCVLIVVLYGVAQYALGARTVLLRGITANWSDASDPDFLEQKNNVIDEAGQSKLTSTYQNGNLLGVNLLLLLPVASLSWGKRTKLLAFPASVAVIGLTASRSAWVGALFLFAVWLLVGQSSWKKRLFLAAALGACTFLFLFRSELGRVRMEASGENSVVGWGGRLLGASVIWEDTLQAEPAAVLLGIHPHESFAYEMVYPSIYETYGLLGLFIWIAPLTVSVYVFCRNRRYPLERAAFVGVLTWMFVGVAEGAFWLPPTSFNLWTVLALGWCGLLSRTGFIEAEQSKILAKGTPRQVAQNA